MDQSASLNDAYATLKQPFRRAEYLMELEGGPSAAEHKEEVFGPVLHIVRWRTDELDRVLDDIARVGFGLTLGMHSRIDATAARVAARLAVIADIRDHAARAGCADAVLERDR